MLRFCLSSSAVQKDILEVLKSSLSSKLSWKPRTILTNSCLCWKDSSPSGNPQPAVLCGELVSGCFAGTHHPFSLPDSTQVSTYPCLSHSQFSGNALALENHFKHGHWTNQHVLSFQPQKWPKNRHDNKIRRLTVSLENLAGPADVKPSRCSCCEIPDFILLS